MALIRCPDCGRDVSDLAPTCPTCGRPIATATAPPVPPAASAPGLTARGGEVLPSNLGQLEALEAPRQARRAPMAALFVGSLVLVGVAAMAVLALGNARAGASRTAGDPATAVSRPAQPTAAATLTGSSPASRRPGSAAAPAAPLPDINGVSCDALESTLVHIHTHLALFVDGQEQVIPFGVGIGQPWQVSDSPEGPFVTDGSCFYWIHTHTEDGVLHIESPVRRSFTLGDFFAIWQTPLSASQLGPIQGTVIAYVNGVRTDADPTQIPLTPHGQIQLDIGQDVPPYAFRFPPGT